MNSSSAASDQALSQTGKLPSHVAIIMDGNGRWAKKRLLNRIKGHEKGSETVRNIVTACREIGISHLTLYAFSTENWQRPKSEVEALMVLLKKFLVSERSELIEKNIRLDTIGQADRLPADVRRELDETMNRTVLNNGLQLTLALSYGGRCEITEMVRAIALKVRSGQLDPDSVTERIVADHLYTRDLPDPDILIRTSGEMRLSNFLLWQLAYTEIFVTDTLWPDFSKDEFLDIIRRFQTRERRFGKIHS